MNRLRHTADTFVAVSGLFLIALVWTQARTGHTAFSAGILAALSAFIATLVWRMSIRGKILTRKEIEFYLGHPESVHMSLTTGGLARTALFIFRAPIGSFFGEIKVVDGRDQVLGTVELPKLAPRFFGIFWNIRVARSPYELRLPLKPPAENGPSLRIWIELDSIIVNSYMGNHLRVGQMNPVEIVLLTP